MASYAMVAKIVFPATDNRKEIIIRNPLSVSVESGWELLTDRAIIKLPRNVSAFDKKKVKEYFRKGDAVLVELGYDGSFFKEFEGYISKEPTANVPIEIKCEDEMWKLKQLPVNISQKETTLQRLLNAIIGDYKLDALEVEIGTVRFAKTTVAKVLEELKKNFGLYSYMKGKTLVCGQIYADDIGTVNYHLEKNVLENNLKYKSATDTRIEVRAVSTQKDGSKIEVTVGDEGGEQRQLSHYNIKSKVELKKLAELDLERFKRDGLDGSITTYGVPFVAHGYKAILASDLYEDRNGTYYVENVKTMFSRDGFRRVVQLGLKVI